MCCNCKRFTIGYATAFWPPSCFRTDQQVKKKKKEKKTHDAPSGYYVALYPLNEILYEYCINSDYVRLQYPADDYPCLPCSGIASKEGDPGATSLSVRLVADRSQVRSVVGLGFLRLLIRSGICMWADVAANHMTRQHLVLVFMM